MIAPRLDPERRCLPVPEWPAIDQTLWAKAQQPASVLDDPGPASAWRPATCEARETAYGRWLGFLQRDGTLDPAAPPHTRVTPDRVALYVAHLRARTASTSTWSMVAHLDGMIRALVPESEWNWLREAANRLKRSMSPARPIRPRLVGIDRLFRTGLTMMREASGRGRPVWRLTHYRDGLMLAFQAALALRLKNLTMIELDRHLSRVSDGFVLRFAGEEMKNHRPYERRIPAALTPSFNRYLAEIRPALLAARSCDTLWITQYGEPMPAHAIHARLTKITTRRFGKRMSSHLFRHDLATTLAIRDPDHIGIAPQLLHHTSFAPTEAFYILAQGLKASRTHAALIRELRQHPDPVPIAEDAPCGP